MGITIVSSPNLSAANDDADTDLSGYDTYAPTPESREPTPLSDNPWERLERNRQRCQWGEERYHYERIFLKESLIDGAQIKYENAQRDGEARNIREKLESFRYIDSARFCLEQEHFQEHINLPKKGWTREQIIAAHEARIGLHEWTKSNPSPEGSGPFCDAATDEEKTLYDICLQKFNSNFIRLYGELQPQELRDDLDFPITQKHEHAMETWRKGIYGRVSRQRQRESLPSTLPNALRMEALEKIDSEEQRDREVLEQAIEMSGKARRPRPRNIFPFFIRTQEEMNDAFRVWDEFGVAS
jgi:hypothetical protein